MTRTRKGRHRCGGAPAAPGPAPAGGRGARLRTRTAQERTLFLVQNLDLISLDAGTHVPS